MKHDPQDPSTKLTEGGILLNEKLSKLVGESLAFTVLRVRGRRVGNRYISGLQDGNAILDIGGDVRGVGLGSAIKDVALAWLLGVPAASVVLLRIPGDRGAGVLVRRDVSVSGSVVACSLNQRSSSPELTEAPIVSVLGESGQQLVKIRIAVLVLTVGLLVLQTDEAIVALLDGAFAASCSHDAAAVRKTQLDGGACDHAIFVAVCRDTLV